MSAVIKRVLQSNNTKSNTNESIKASTKMKETDPAKADPGGGEVISKIEYDKLLQRIKELEKDNEEKKKQFISERDAQWQEKVKAIIKEQNERTEKIKSEIIDSNNQVRMELLAKNEELQTTILRYENLLSQSKHTYNDLQTNNNDSDFEDVDMEQDINPQITKTNNNKKRTDNSDTLVPNKRLAISDSTWPNLPKSQNPALIQNFEKTGLKPISKEHKIVKQDTSAKDDATTKKSNKVPPIILREKEKFNSLTSHLKAHNINFDRAVTVKEGVKLFPSTPLDYNKIIKTLDIEKIQYHSFRLPDEKPLHVIIRGALESWSVEKIKKDLEEINFTPSKVVRWYHKNGKPMPLVLVILPKSEKRIFDLKVLDQLSIKIESQKTKTTVTQCYRCQIYGHSQFRCTAEPKCLKCAKKHLTFECKEVIVNPTCANCGEDHTANDRRCKHHPTNVKIITVENSKKRIASQFAGWGTQNNKLLASSVMPVEITGSTDENTTVTMKVMQQAFQQFAAEIGKTFQIQIKDMFSQFNKN